MVTELGGLGHLQLQVVDSQNGQICVSGAWIRVRQLQGSRWTSLSLDSEASHGFSQQADKHLNMVTMAITPISGLLLRTPNTPIDRD